MPVRFRAAALALLVAGVAGCWSDPRDRPHVPPGSYGYGNENVDPAVFKDDAPSNPAAAAADLPLAFVDADGKPVELATYRGKPVVLVVMRGVPESPGGVFCPGCLAQTGSLSANHAEFKKRGAEVLMVFPGKADRVAEFVRQAKAEGGDQSAGGLPFPVLLDRDLAAVTKLGIRGDLAKPSTYVLDRGGNVVYAYVGETYTDRPSLKAILAQLDKLPQPAGAK